LVEIFYCPVIYIDLQVFTSWLFHYVIIRYQGYEDSSLVMTLIKARQWSEIEAHYLGWEEGKEILEVVRYLRANGTAERLFAYTSLYNLVISLYDQIEPHRESLHIRREINGVGGYYWELSYYARPDLESEFVRQYPAGTLCEKLDAFLRYIRW
jgi:hypothetical protein